MNQYFYLKIKKNSNFNKFIFKKSDLKIKKIQKAKKFKFKPCIFFYKKKLNFKNSNLLLNLSFNERKFNLWEKVDYMFHIFFYYNVRKYEDYTVFINFLESRKYLNVLYYLLYAKKKKFILKKKQIIKDQRNVIFWIWIVNINVGFILYFHNVKRFLYKFINNKNYSYRLFKKNIIRYNSSFFTLKILSFILEEDFKKKVLNSAKSKLNSKIKYLKNLRNTIKNTIKKNVYTSFHYFYFKFKWKLIILKYIIANDIRNTKILHLWSLGYIAVFFFDIFWNKIKKKIGLLYYNVDNIKCIIKIFKIKNKIHFKKKKKKKKEKINFDFKYVIKQLWILFLFTLEEIKDFIYLFVDKYLYNDFKNKIKKSKEYIYPEFLILKNYIKNFFKK